MAKVPIPVLAGLLTLWFLGLVAHAPVLMAALPGLSARQALALNLSGTAVSNVIPVGGPAGMGLGYAMARSWGFRSDRFAGYVVATGLWNVLGKFTTGISVLAVAAVFGIGVASGLGLVILGAAAVVLVVVTGVTVATLRTESSATAMGLRLDRIVSRFRWAPHALTCSSLDLS